MISKILVAFFPQGQTGSCITAGNHALLDSSKTQILMFHRISFTISMGEYRDSALTKINGGM